MQVLAYSRTTLIAKIEPSRPSSDSEHQLHIRTKLRDNKQSLRTHCSPIIHKISPFNSHLWGEQICHYSRGGKKARCLVFHFLNNIVSYLYIYLASVPPQCSVDNINKRRNGYSSYHVWLPYCLPCRLQGVSHVQIKASHQA